MSILRKATASVALTVSIAALAGSAQAAGTTILTFGGTPGTVTWSKASGANGRLFAGATYGGSTLTDVTAPPVVAESGVTWSFSADFVAGTSQNLGGGIKVAQFNNGTFSFTGIGGNILSGTFSSGTLVSNNGAITFSVGSNGVNYTGGTALVGAPGNVGDMSFGISGHGLASGWNMSAGNITTNTFTGQAGGTFDASSGVPEPGEWAAMGILATGLTGLMVRARRRK
ncbi:MAG: PEP-CTERM sorting domain-containing protein [Armatimonadaceae bacterium]